MEIHFLVIHRGICGVCVGGVGVNSFIFPAQPLQLQLLAPPTLTPRTLSLYSAIFPRCRDTAASGYRPTVSIHGRGSWKVSECCSQQGFTECGFRFDVAIAERIQGNTAANGSRERRVTGSRGSAGHWAAVSRDRFPTPPLVALEGEHTAFDAELSAIVETIELLTGRVESGKCYVIFTDSQAAMRRLQNDPPGPGQQLAIRGIRGSRCISQQDQ